MPTPSLKNFILPVPVVYEDAKLSAVLEIFRQGSGDRLVVVSQQQCPLGLIHLPSLMPHLIGRMNAEGGTSNEFPINTSSSPPGKASLRRKHYILDAFIEPLATLPAEISLSQFWPMVQNQMGSENNRQWALVDPDGKFLGLLDSWLLLKYLASRDAFAEKQQSALKPLVQLLEQLPLPLMLQTGSGQVITQNITWRQQIGESLDPDSLISEAAELLKPLPSLPQESLAVEDTTYQQYEYADANRTSYFSTDSGGSTNAGGVRSVSTVMASASIDLKTQGVPTNCKTLSEAKQRKKKGKKDASEGKPLGVREAQPEGDRIWQFVKIPLQELEVSGKLKKGQRTTDNGQIWLVLATDVTQQQQVAKELAAKNADLVQLNRLKDEFLACITHELKTPLTTVLGLSSLLKDRLLGELNERQARYTQLIHQSGCQLMTVVNDIFDLTHMETGQIELTLAPVKIPDVCASAYLKAQQLQPARDERLGESPHQTLFTLEIELGLETMVADESRLRQMLVHLLSNALKFTDLGGEIGLKVSRWEGWIAFIVWDTGIGISQELQHLIFQKFQQLENPLTRQFPGTGLGLVLTQRLARLHGGDVSFISKPGQGSQFTLLLPPSPPQSSATIDSSRSEAKLRCSYVNINRLVLIVEAVPDYIEDLTEQLTSLGYRVAIARSGTEAIEKARRFQPRAVLLNPLLPQLSGWDVLTLLKSDAQTRHIPVVVTASSAEKETATSNQADGFLSLPVEASALRQSLTNLTKQRFGDRLPLTILRLTPDRDFTSSSNLWSTAIGLEPPSALNYRVLEADDLEQAELLSRVWHPDVVLLDSADLSDPIAFLQQLSQHPNLASLPLVTLDRQTTEAANQITGLSVFPCLEPAKSNDTAALLQVVQVAAGMCWQPTILVVDMATLSEGTSEIAPSHEWLQALIQYLQTAGFRSLLSHSWAEVSRQLQHQNVDLLLIHLGDMQPDNELVKALTSQALLQALPPVLVLDRRRGDPPPRPYANDLEAVLKAVCTDAVSMHSQSMAELLDLIDRTMANR